MRTLDLRGIKPNAQGAYAGYFKLSNTRGVRVYGLGEFTSGTTQRAPLKAEINFDEANKDFNFMNEIKCELTPSAFEVVAVRYDKGWYPGVIMEHCAGIELFKAMEFDTSSKFDNTLNELKKRFEELTGYRHEDMHGGNVIYNKKNKRFKVIDLCVDFATPSNRV